MNKKIDEILTRGVEQVLPTKKGLAALMEKRRIKLYQGFDPSMPSLHLGNYVGLLKLAQFQRLGHQVIFLVGDFTGMIGDPTDKLTTRKKLARKQVLQNAKAWREQAGRVLDFNGPNAAKIIFNSEWNDKITFKDLIETTSNFTVQQLLERDFFQERMKKGKPIHLHEFLYPVAQAIDCVEMDVDLEIGGSDQLFNMMVGRTLMKAIKEKEKYILTTKLLVDSQGQKVGKTTGNALFMDSKPEEFFAGIMSFPDEVIELGFEILTLVDLEGLKDKIKKDPLGQKLNLAYEVVKILWGEGKADTAQAHFQKTFQKRKPEYKKEIKARGNLLKTIADLVGSKSQAKRLITQGGIDIDGQTVNDPKTKIKGGEKLKIGKKRFLKVTNE